MKIRPEIVSTHSNLLAHSADLAWLRLVLGELLRNPPLGAIRESFYTLGKMQSAYQELQPAGSLQGLAEPRRILLPQVVVGTAS